MKTQRTIVASSIAALLASTGSAVAADDQEIQEIRKEIQDLKENYESRIKSLEERLQAAEEKAQKAEAAASKAESRAEQAAEAPPANTPSGQNAFNPAIGLILSGVYTNLSKDPETWRIGGFVPSGEEIGPGERSLSLGESELNVSANVDPYFYGNLTLALTREGEAEVEEGYFKTLALPGGLILKGGRFFSGIGYLNDVHAHAWDFADQPLVYQAFLGNQLKQEGLQLKWIAPTPIFLEFGAEASRGGEFPGTERNKNGSGAGAGFVHVGGDVGHSNSWRAGVSYLRHSPREREFEEESGTFGGIANAFTGTSKLWIADFIWKWAPNGNPIERNFKIQAEYFRRKENGDLAFNLAGDPADPVLGPFAGITGPYFSTQSGWYLQGVYQFLPRWRVGLRYDELDSGTLDNGLLGLTDGTTTLTEDDFSGLKAHRPKRATLMLDWNPSEFSRIRLQYAQDRARPDESDNQFFIQYLYSLGAHGAHKF